MAIGSSTWMSLCGLSFSSANVTSSNHAWIDAIYEHGWASYVDRCAYAEAFAIVNSKQPMSFSKLAWHLSAFVFQRLLLHMFFLYYCSNFSPRVRFQRNYPSTLYERRTRRCSFRRPHYKRPNWYRSICSAGNFIF